MKETSKRQDTDGVTIHCNAPTICPLLSADVVVSTLVPTAVAAVAEGDLHILGASVHL